MIIDKLILHNFGVYAGRHEIALTPTSKQKPIALFGGLNGGGKTTFLDALLLVLYGKFAKCSNRNNLSYDDFLRKCINRKVCPKDGAGLILEFRHRQSNVEESIKISRSWRATGKGIREDVTVYRDGQVDPESTDRWYEFVEEIIPSRIANLFFFDGEKIEDLATPDHAADLLKTGIYALLGLDLIETLEQDLRVVERRCKSRLGTTEDQERLQSLTSHMDDLESRRAEIHQEKGSCQSRLDLLTKERRRLEQRYKDQGGDLYDRRAEIMDAHERANRELLLLQDRMREVAAGDAPLLLVENLMHEAFSQCAADKEVTTNEQSLALLEDRDRLLLDHISSLKIDDSTAKLVSEFLTDDRKSRSQTVDQASIIGIEPEVFGILHADLLSQTRQSISDLLLHVEHVENDIAKLDRRLGSIPDPEGLEGISHDLAENEKATLILEHKLIELGEQLDQIASAIDRKQAQIDNLLDSTVRSQFATEKSKRVIEQADKTRNVLSMFRERISTVHIRRLEDLILDSYLTLMRKQSLVAKVEIVPETFDLRLHTSERTEIPLERLSAGERQLLAVAILWGLSKASGRPLPTVIDTPLGRLDGSHRENLVTSYFPAASHQVILLSTDKEIDVEYYAAISKFVGREYSIEYDDSAQSSQVKDGYLWKGAA